MIEAMKAGRETWRCSVFEMCAAWIDQYDAAVTSGHRAFDQLTECFEYHRHRLATCDHLEQLLFAGEQCFSPLAVIDVGVHDVPADDTTSRIRERHHAPMEPTIDAVGTAYAVVDVVWFHPSGGDRSLRRCDHRRKIVRMDRLARSPAFQLFERCAQVLEDLAVGVLDFAGRRQEGDHGRNDIGDRAMVILAAVLIRRSGPPEIVDVGACSTPLDDLPGGFGQRPRAELEPAIFSIEAPQARFHAARLAGRQDGSPALEQAMPVVGMDGELPARSMGLLDAKSGIAAPMSIEEVDLPVRLRSPHQSRKVNRRRN